MKAIPLLSLLVLATPLAAQNDAKPAEKQPNGVAAAYSPNQQAFLNLPEANRNEFIKHLSEADRLFKQKRIFETLEELDKVEKIFADSPEVYNLRGNCFVEMRAFDKALAQFEKARSFAKNNASLDFNIAEIYFVTKEWKKSLELLDKVLKNLPPQSIALARLVEFKKLLCMSKLGMKDEAKNLSEKYDFLDDSPFYYYAQAALAYDKQDVMAAEAWIARANRIFRDPNVLSPWQDTLVEYGYIKGFFGEEAPEE
jgi:tetratricopeptide (TPR) repeat protein